MEEGPPRPAVVWGRRRAGKTALLHEFARDLRSIFHTGAGRAPGYELAHLARQVNAAGRHRANGLDRSPGRPYRDWYEALDHLALGQPWEAAFRDHVRRLAAAGEIGEQVVAVGPFWTEDGESEMDAVALAGRARRAIFAGEAKWAKEVGTSRIAANLQRKITALPGASAGLAQKSPLPCAPGSGYVAYRKGYGR